MDDPNVILEDMIEFLSIQKKVLVIVRNTIACCGDFSQKNFCEHFKYSVEQKLLSNNCSCFGDKPVAITVGNSSSEDEYHITIMIPAPKDHDTPLYDIRFNWLGKITNFFV